jgi:predicted HNH restriction endonuclease
MKLNQLARMVIRKMSISIGIKGKKPFCSPILVKFDRNWKRNGRLHLRHEVAKSLEIVDWPRSGATQSSHKKPLIKDTVDPPDPDSFLEGSSKNMFFRRIERKTAARNACIRKHKAICAVCGLCFGEKYGKDFAGLVQVHHLHPLGFGKARQTDPQKDLRPICPNCHAMAHWKKYKKAPRSINKLKRIIKDAA